MTVRRAMAVRLNDGAEAEYERRHNPIWRELDATLREHGVLTYSIYLDAETGLLFAYVEVEDQSRWDAIADTDVCRRWWEHMRTLMDTDEDARPRWRDLREVFHIESAQ